jgi:hypothetical protein
VEICPLGLGEVCAFHLIQQLQYLVWPPLIAEQVSKVEQGFRFQLGAPRWFLLSAWGDLVQEVWATV